MWMDSCDVFDGFMQEGCSSSYQEGMQVSSIKLSGKIQQVTLEAGAAFASSGEDDRTWQVYPVGSNGTTETDSFYVLNGISRIDARTKAVCIEKRIKSKNQVCSYYREDNMDFWPPEQAILEIAVKENCDVNEYTVDMKPDLCYDIMTKDACK